VVDVRDVAQAHLKAILIPEAANKRFILVGESLWLKDLCDALYGAYGKDYNSIPTRVYPYYLLRFFNYWYNIETLRTVVAYCSSFLYTYLLSQPTTASASSAYDLADVLENWGREESFDTHHAKDILKIQFRDVRTALVAMAGTLIDAGYIPDLRTDKPEVKKVDRPIRD